MSEEQGKNVKDGVKKGVSIVGKVIKWVLLAFLVIIVGVIAYSCYACSSVTKAVVDATADSSLVREAVRDATGGDDKAKMSSEAIAVTAIDLYSAYDSNALRADNTYKGKYVRVTGVVNSIDQDLITKRPYAKLISDNNQYFNTDYVYVYFKETELNRVADLDNGKRITIVGMCEGKGLLSVNIRDSFFE